MTDETGWETNHPNTAPGGKRKPLNNAAIIIEPIEPQLCQECETYKATVQITIDLQAEYGITLFEGFYCDECQPH